jgi:signal transduction histidine kinase
MVKTLASRVAGLRLFSIVAVLLVPTVILSFIAFQDINQKLGQAGKAYQGVLLLDNLITLALGTAESSLTSEAVVQQISAAKPRAEALGMGDALADLEMVMASPSVSSQERLRAIVEILERTNEHSTLHVEADPETHFLAHVALHELPEQLADFHDFEQRLSTAMASSGIDGMELKAVLVSIGRVRRSIQTTLATLESARQESHVTGKYDDLLVLANGMEKELATTQMRVEEAAPGTEWMALTMLAGQAINVGGKYRLARDAWTDVATQLAALMQQRSSDLSKRFAMLLGLAGSCILFGAGTAYWMFRATLNRLDHVQSAHDEAQAARNEAEELASRVRSINEHMAGLNTELANKVQHLAELQDDLVKKGRMEQLGQLTATIAHEIRNPLGAVRTSAFLLEKKLQGKGLGVEAQFERINNGVSRCDNIITQLLDFSRSKQLDSASGDLDSWLATVVEEEAERLPEAVAIECHLGLDNAVVPFDHDRLRRAVTNLMNNASEAMVGTGEDRARFATQNPRIVISTFKVENGVALRVADNGLGMSAEVLARVREPLYTTKSFGTGLGLPAVEQIAALHGGRLDIESKPGEGATFTIILSAAHKLRDAA